MGFVYNDGIGKVDLVDYLGDDSTIIKAARVSYNKGITNLNRDSKLIRFLLEQKHTSPFEHVVFSFEVECPIFVARQWMRHRTFSYNEVSRRYTSEDIKFYIPENLRKQDSKNKQSSIEEYSDSLNKYIKDIKNVSEYCIDLYIKMLSDGVCREQARMILPLNLYTKFICTADLHNLLHFLNLRLRPEAQLEIRVYAQEILKIIEPIVPITIKHWKELNGIS